MVVSSLVPGLMGESVGSLCLLCGCRGGAIRLCSGGCGFGGLLACIGGLFIGCRYLAIQITNGLVGLLLVVVGLFL